MILNGVRPVLGPMLALALLLASARLAVAEEVGRGGVYSVVELSFLGPGQGRSDSPARDIEFRVRLRHEGGKAEHEVFGFWDGNGRGGPSGNVFKVRFCPTRPGRWVLAEVRSNVEKLDGQHEGGYVTATPSDLHGFWVVDPEGPGLRWYMRSDGSHQYIIGNTHYSFLSGYRDGGRPSGNDIARDVARNAGYFKKLRFGLQADRYPDPAEKPFLDDEGRPTDDGDYSHRPNPSWFHDRADVAVRTAFEHDLIADLILCGPDTKDSRSTLKAGRNGGDPTPYLRYVAARYGSYPNVWLCLANEFNIKQPRYTEKQVARFGRTIRRFLPYPTPLSVHSAPSRWPARFDDLPPWNDHQIIQHKLRRLSQAADSIKRTWTGPDGGPPRLKPTVNDELSYQGEGDGHSEADTVEAHLGAFLGGGYGSTGYKPGNKLGHYFWGRFDPEEHTAADNLKWLREAIDAHITFGKMAPDESVFEDLAPAFRGLAWPGREYVLGTGQAREGIIADLPPGTWTVLRFDVLAREATTLAKEARGRYTFDAPDSQAVLFLFKKNGGKSRPDDTD